MFQVQDRCPYSG